MQDESEDIDPEFVKRMGQKAVRLAHLKMGLVPFMEYTQEDFDHELRAAMWRAEPDDFDPDDWTEDTPEDA